VKVSTSPYYAAANGTFSGMGTFSAADSSMVLNFGLGLWTGTFTPQAGLAADPFDVVPTRLSRSGNDVTLEFKVNGQPLHVADADQGIPVSEIAVYWASGPNRGDVLPGGLIGQVPVYWNQAGGTAVVRSTQYVPPGASYLVVVADPDNKLDEGLAGEANNVLAFGTPTISFVDAQVEVAEETPSGQAASAQFKVRLSSRSDVPVTVSYAMTAGTATAGKDYKSAKGKLTFKPGETEKTIAVPIVSDKLNELDETFQVTLSGAKNATLPPASAVATCTIIDNDAEPTLSIADVSLKEGNSKQTKATFTVTLSAASGKTVTVAYVTAHDDSGAHPADSTASDNDYVPVTSPATLTFPPGTMSQKIAILVIGDKTYEADETFLVRLSGATNASLSDDSATGTIKNDDALPAISIDNRSVNEGPGGTLIEFTVSLAAASELPVTVDYATADKTAKAGMDYAETHGTLTFAPGQTTAKVSVTVYGDSNKEPTKTFFVNLSNAVGGKLSKKQGTGTIKDYVPPKLLVAAMSVPQPAGSWFGRPNDATVDEAIRLLA